MIALFTDIAGRAGAAAPDALGRQLLILMEGATAVAAHRGPDRAHEQACAAALSLLHTAATAPGDRLPPDSTTGRGNPSGRPEPAGRSGEGGTPDTPRAASGSDSA
ncbi:hypothetical protein [Nocardia testacea]|uniref:hypothetical protein n=1 Tax=Nocardia testacea TaxID=248551 RepID=UPI003A8607A2